MNFLEQKSKSICLTWTAHCRSETVHFDKITSRIEKLCYGLASEYLDIPAITLKVSLSKYGTINQNSEFV